MEKDELLLQQKVEQQEEARRKIRGFIKSIQRVRHASDKKQRIAAFSEEYLRYPLDAAETDIEFLLTGGKDDKYKGIMVTCGEISKSTRQLRKSTPKALELMFRLVFHETNPYSKKFLAVLGRLDVQYLKSMRLGLHLMDAEDETDSIVFQFINIIDFDRQVPHEPADYIGNLGALDLYQDWCDEAQLDENAEDSDVERWSQVEPFDPNMEEGGDQVAALVEAEADHAQKGSLMDPLGIAGDILVAKVKKEKKRNFHIKGVGQALGGSISPDAKDFNPTLFLTEVHSKTALRDLEKGLDTIQGLVGSRSEQIKRLVRQYFSQYCYCKEIVDRVHESFKLELTMNQARTEPMKQLISNIKASADGQFGPVLKGKTESDKIRATLQVLQRNQFLFSIPKSLRLHIQQERYEPVVRDYKKAKSLVMPTQGSTTLFKRVLEEIFHIVAEFREELFLKLGDSTASDETQQNIIGYLRELDCKRDPAWYYMEKRKEHLCERLKQANELVQCNGISPFQIGKKVPSVNESNHLKVKKLCAIFQNSVLGFCAILENLTTTHPTTASRNRKGTATDRKRRVNKNKPSNAEAEEQLKARSRALKLVQQVADCFVGEVHKAMPTLPENCESGPHKMPMPAVREGDGLGDDSEDLSVMRENVRVVLATFQHIQDKVATISFEYMGSVEALADDLRKYYVKHTMQRALRDITHLADQEDWVASKHNPTITNLPFAFESVIGDALDCLRVISDTTNLNNKEHAQDMFGPFLESVHAFIDVLHFLAFHRPSGASGIGVRSKNGPVEINHPYSIDSETCNILRIGDSERHVLIVLSNAIHTADCVFPSVFQRFQRLMPVEVRQQLRKLFMGVSENLEVLQKMLQKQYCLHKVEAVIRTIHGGVFGEGINWEKAPYPTNVRHYIMFALLQISHVHSELYSLSANSHENRSMLQRVLNSVCNTFLHYVHEIGYFSVNGAVQLIIESHFLSRKLQPLLSDDSVAIFDQIESFLAVQAGSHVDEDGELSDQWKELVLAFEQSTAAMFGFFDVPDSGLQSGVNSA